MQEQQQQQVKAMLGPRGQLAYYGLRLPMQQQQQAGSTAVPRTGMCPQFKSIMLPTTTTTAVQSVPHTLFLPSCQSPSVSKVTGEGSVGLSSASPSNTPQSPTNTGTSNTNIASCNSNGESSNIPSSLTNSLANSTTSSTSSSVSIEASTTPSSSINTSATNYNKALSTVASSVLNKVCNITRRVPNSMVDKVSSSTSPSSGSDAGKGESSKGRGQQHEGVGRKSHPPPSRMVTRSQTAAVRTPSLVDDDNDEQPRAPRMKSQRRSRSHSDREGGLSPRRLRLESCNSSTIGFDDFPLAKNPAGAGIEFGAVCPDCGAVAVTGTGWNAHQGAHRGEGAPCGHCTQVFLTTHGRDSHQQLHREGHKWDVDDYCECGICGGSFISILYLELHLLELHGRDALYDQRALHLGPSTATEASCTPEDESGGQLFRCGVCQTLFTYSLNLDCHMSLHTEVSYACAVCDADFPTLDPLVNHSRMHRFPGGGGAATAGGVPVHLRSPHGPVRSRHPPITQRHPMQHHMTPPPFGMWGGLQHPRTNQLPTFPPSPACPASPMNLPMNPMTPHHMSPAMLNYCMMMSLWAGDKANTGHDNSAWANYFNPAMTNMFNYINPYLLNNNNNNSNNNNTGDTKTEVMKAEREECEGSIDGSEEDSGDESM